MIVNYDHKTFIGQAAGQHNQKINIFLNLRAKSLATVRATSAATATAVLAKATTTPVGASRQTVMPPTKSKGKGNK
jgi:hypothetical protein